MVAGQRFNRKSVAEDNILGLFPLMIVEQYCYVTAVSYTFFNSFFKKMYKMYIYLSIDSQQIHTFFLGMLTKSSPADSDNNFSLHLLSCFVPVACTVSHILLCSF